jgi:predicted aspartyl protease
MKHKLNLGLAVRAALLYFTLAWVSQSIWAQGEVPFRTVNNTLIIMALTANGEGPFDFVLDTGADTTIVDQSLAVKLSLPSLSRVQQTTLAGVQTLDRGSIQILLAGPVKVENVPVLIQDLSELRKLDSHVDGIAGQNFLSHFNYLLNYRKRVIQIELGNEIRDAVGGDQIPIESSGNRMFVASEAQSVERAKLRLLLDSGTNSIVLLSHASRTLHVPVRQIGLEKTISGSVRLEVGRLRMLTIGSEQFRNIAVALPAAEPAERIGDGLLPTVLFQALYVNNREHFIVLNPQDRKNQTQPSDASLMPALQRMHF